MKTERITASTIENNIRNRLNETLGEVESLRAKVGQLRTALGRIMNYPHTTSELESDEMRRIAKEALES